LASPVHPSELGSGEDKGAQPPRKTGGEVGNMSSVRERVRGFAYALRRPLPVWMGLCLIALAASMLTFTIASAATEYSIVKPFAATLTFTEPMLKIESVEFSPYYNATLDQYTSCDVTVKNYDTSTAHSGTVYVYLYDAAGDVVASGQLSFDPISPSGQVTLTVTLTWVSGKSLDDVASGRVVVA